MYLNLIPEAQKSTMQIPNYQKMKATEILRRNDFAIIFAPTEWKLVFSSGSFIEILNSLTRGSPLQKF